MIRRWVVVVIAGPKDRNGGEGLLNPVRVWIIRIHVSKKR